VVHTDEQRDYREYDFLDTRNVLLLYSMNLPLLPGLGLGLVRSLRGALGSRRNRGARLRGTLAGLFYSFSKWPQRAPMSLRRYRAWCELRRGGVAARHAARCETAT